MPRQLPPSATRPPRRAIVWSKIAVGLYLVAFIPVVVLVLLDDYFDTDLLWTMLVVFGVPVALSVFALLGALKDAGRSPAGAAVMWQTLWMLPLLVMTFGFGVLIYLPGFIAQIVALTATPKADRRPCLAGDP
jgi:hypothetical protein